MTDYRHKLVEWGEEEEERERDEAILPSLYYVSAVRWERKRETERRFDNCAV
jgi:hypothetical protein